jgi:hypothetical protein
MLILLNGPPRSGKDTAGRILHEVLGYPLHKFTEPMDRALPAFVGITPERWAFLREHAKDKACEELGGLLPREVLISFSETWAKPLFGRDIFGQLMRRSLQAQPAILTDCGFRREVECVVPDYPPEEVLLLRLHRPGCTFSKDSRAYITLADLGVRELDLENHGTLAAFDEQIRRLALDISIRSSADTPCTTSNRSPASPVS